MTKKLAKTDGYAPEADLDIIPPFSKFVRPDKLGLDRLLHLLNSVRADGIGPALKIKN